MRILGRIIPAKKRKSFLPLRGTGYEVNGQHMVVDFVSQNSLGVLVRFVPVKEYKQ